MFTRYISLISTLGPQETVQCHGRQLRHSKGFPFRDVGPTRFDQFGHVTQPNEKKCSVHSLHSSPPRPITVPHMDKSILNRTLKTQKVLVNPRGTIHTFENIWIPWFRVFRPSFIGDFDSAKSQSVRKDYFALKNISPQKEESERGSKPYNQHPYHSL